ncbi:MAG: exonuclease subunit SbcD [Leptospiraceae bacterium]|nr:exonuclease subunit SbcD [Leptospiraceae bacterium]
MRILHTSDWHLGKTLHEHSLLEDQQHFLNWLLDYLDAHPHDVLLIAGDVYDRSLPPAEAVGLMSQFLASIRRRSEIPIILIPGNHDSARRLAYLSEVVASRGIFIVSDLEQAASPISIDGADFYAIPFLNPYEIEFPETNGGRIDRSHEAAMQFAMDRIGPVLKPDRINIALAHMFATGGSTSDSERAFVGASGEVNIALLQSFDYVALGHLHRPQKVSDNAWYSGSPIAYSFSEAGDAKCVLSVEIGGSVEAGASAETGAVESPRSPVGESSGGGNSAEAAKATPAVKKKKKDRSGQESLPLLWESASAAKLEVHRIEVPAMRKVTRLKGTLSDLLENPDYEKHVADYLEVEITDPAFSGSPLATLSKRFPFLLSIRRSAPPVAEGSDFPVREGKTIEDDFEAFQDYLYPEGENPLLSQKKELFEKEASN